MKCIPIRICGARNVTEPVVEQEIVLSHRAKDGYLVLGKVLNDIGGTSQVIRVMGNFVFYDEAEHAFLLLDDFRRI